MLRCRFGALDYLIPLASVLEIVRFVRPTPVPETAPWIGGVINLRGRIYAVLDLAVKFGESESVPGDQTCIVLVQSPAEHAAPVGLIAEHVATIHPLRRGDLDPPRAGATRLRTEFLDGSLETPEGAALVLNLERVLAAEGLLTSLPPSHADFPKSQA